MNKTMLKAAAGGAALAVAALGATAAQAATANGTARASIVTAVTVTNTTDLNYGQIVTSATAGSATVDATGARTCAGGVACSGASSAANFNLTGTNNYVVAVSAPATVTLTSGANNMTSTLALSANTVTLSATGTGAFTVGGALTVAANQPDGNYAGTFTVTADYQ